MGKQTNHHPIIFLSFLLLLLLTPLSSSLRFDLQSGSTKCISEDIKLQAMTVGKYSIVNPNENQPLPDSHRVSVRVTSPYGNSVHHADNVESGNFALTALEAGDYLACFWTPEHKPAQTVTLEFEWKTGVAAKDWTSVAKKGAIDVSNRLCMGLSWLIGEEEGGERIVGYMGGILDILHGHVQCTYKPVNVLLTLSVEI